MCVGGGGGRTKKFIMPGQEFILVSNSEGRAWALDQYTERSRRWGSGNKEEEHMSLVNIVGSTLMRSIREHISSM